jgi:hypothetical protein
MTYGQGVADRETVPQALEDALNGKDPARRRWRVVNGGHRGFSTNQELALLRTRGLEVEPDLVVLFWYWNDCEEPSIERIHAKLAASGPVPFDVGKPLEGWTRLAWHARQLPRRSALLMLAYDLWRASRAGFPPPQWEEQGLRNLDRHLNELLALGEQHGFRALFAGVPDPGDVLTVHPSRGVTRRALEVAARRGLPAVDLREPLVELCADGRRVPILPYDGHYAAASNRAMGSYLAEFILARGAELGL